MKLLRPFLFLARIFRPLPSIASSLLSISSSLSTLTRIELLRLANDGYHLPPEKSKLPISPTDSDLTELSYTVKLPEVDSSGRPIIDGLEEDIARFTDLRKIFGITSANKD